MAQEVSSHTFANGLTLLVESMSSVRSAAFNILVPAGCAYDPPDSQGIASVLSDLITRGAGKNDSRQLTQALDSLGLDRDESVGTFHMRFWGATLARNLLPSLTLYADILRRPHLPEAELPPVQALALQDIQSLEDEPRQKVLVELRKRHFPPPLGRDRRGTVEGIEGLTPALLRAHHQRLFSPAGTIISVAGNVQWQPVFERVEWLFADWQQPVVNPVSPGPSLPKREHLHKDTHQTQISLAWKSVPIGHAEYYQALGAVNVLSGGMSSRLFTEVREKRGLCYAIWASYQTFKDQAGVICYAGTTNERAQETLDVTVAELERLGKGIEADEVSRLQAGLKSSLIMQEESTSARAGSIASDWYYLGRVRSLDEIQKAIEDLTPESIAEHVRRFPPRDFTAVTLGPKPLSLPGPN